MPLAKAVRARTMGRPPTLADQCTAYLEVVEALLDAGWFVLQFLLGRMDAATAVCEVAACSRRAVRAVEDGRL